MRACDFAPRRRSGGQRCKLSIILLQQTPQCSSKIPGKLSKRFGGSGKRAFAWRGGGNEFKAECKNQTEFPSLMLIRRHSECHAKLRSFARKRRSFPVASLSFNFICLFDPDYTPKGIGLAASFIENIIFSLKEFREFREIIHYWFYPVAPKITSAHFQAGFGDIVVTMTGQLAA